MAELQFLPTPNTSMEELLTCKQCLKKYKLPKTLPCQHTFCLSCLESLKPTETAISKTQQLSIACPECKEMASIPNNKAELLPTSFVIENLAEIEKLFTEAEDIAQHAQNYQSNSTAKNYSNESLNDSLGKDMQCSKKNRDFFPKHNKATFMSGLKYPWGVAHTKNNKLVVAEWGSNQISVLNLEGEKQLTFGSSNKTNHKFINPRGVAIYKDMQFLVTSSHCIQLYNMSGELIGAVGTKGSNELQFESPTGIAVHPMTGYIYIADSDNHRIQVLNEDFTFSHTIGSKGTDNGEFYFPWDVTIDKNGLLYVADGNSRIQKFTLEGIYIDCFGKQGRNHGEMNRPSSIAIDKNNFLYVTELHNNRVSVYTSNGEFANMYCIEDKDSSVPLNGPCGITVNDERNEVYVTDCWNDRIVVFKTCQLTL